MKKKELKKKLDKALGDKHINISDDDLLIIAEDWTIKNASQKSTSMIDPISGLQYFDVAESEGYYRLIGTEKQLKDFKAEKNKIGWHFDECYEFDLQKSEKKDYYLDLYQEKKNEVLIIEIRG